MPTPYVDQVILDDWLSFAEVGHYSVGIAFDGTVRPAPGVAVDVARERAFDVTVTPRSERALQEYCQEQLVAARDTHARWLALQLLSHVVDPAAVPFLERAVTQFQALALTQTMVEVGTTQARQALQRLTSDPDETVRQAATAALTRMGR